MASKAHPPRFDCYANAEHEEEYFVLLGRDPLGAWLVRVWCAVRVAIGKNRWTDDQIREAQACADRMENWCRKKGKTPVGS